MLNSHNGQIDYDGYIALILTVLLLIVTGGLGLILLMVHIWFKANLTNSNLKISTILVLGKKLINEKPDKEFITRLKRVIKILKHNPEAQIYILGGNTGGKISESLAGKRFLLENNINSNNIIIEEKSRHTLENLKNFSQIALLNEQTIYMLTNRYHMARSLIMASGFKMNIQPCFAEDTFKYNFKNSSKIFLEAFYCHFYLVGKYLAIITKNNRVLKRISVL
jgi:uncharacterized SAM-binding protein YcdF (DUF218 family)